MFFCAPLVRRCVMDVEVVQVGMACREGVLLGLLVLIFLRFDMTCVD